MSQRKSSAEYENWVASRPPEELRMMWIQLADSTRAILKQMDHHGCFPNADHVPALLRTADYILGYLESTAPKHEADPPDDGSLYCPPPNYIQEIIVEFNEQMKLFADETLQCKVVDIMENCLLDARMPPEELVGNTLLIVVHHCINPPNVREHKAWVRKCLALSPFFDMIDFSSCSEFYRTVLCLVRIEVMNLEEGRKLIASLFPLSIQTTRDLHGILKQTLFDFHRKSIWDCIGDIYYRAYINSEGQITLKLEEIIQAYMEPAIKCTDEKRFRRLLCVLDAFHKNGDNKVVMGLLERSYGPILFRALSYPNDVLRRNALHLFAHAFPIRSPEWPRQEVAKKVEEQFGQLIAFLDDKNPNIRADAVECVCNALRTRWGMIGVPTALPVLNTIFKDLSNDSSNKVVRLGVMKGAEILLGDVVSHQHIKPLLPNLATCLHDSSAVVRLAFVRLLKNIAQIRHIAFWEAVSIPQLIQRMGRDPSEAIMDELAGLLRHNFLPTNMESAERIQRCAFLIKIDPVAALQFYRRVRHQCNSPQGCFELLQALVQWCTQCLEAHQGTRTPAAKKAKTANSGKKHKSASQSSDGGEPAGVSHPDSMKEHVKPQKACQDFHLMHGAMNVIGCLIQSLSKDWANLDTIQLRDDLRHLVTQMPVAYQQPAMETVCSWIDAITPDPNAATKECIGHIRTLMANHKAGPAGAAPQWRIQLLSACLKGKLPQLLDTILEKLQVNNPSTLPLTFLTYLLVNPQTRHVVLHAWATECRDKIDKVVTILQQQCEKRIPELLIADAISEASSAYVVTACNLLSRLVLHRYFLPTEASLVNTTDKQQPKGSKKKKPECSKTIPFRFSDLLQLYAKVVLPQAIACFQGAAEQLVPSQNTGRKRGRKAEQAPEPSPSTVLDNFKAQLCETVVLWIEEALACGLLSFAAPKASDEIKIELQSQGQPCTSDQLPDIANTTFPQIPDPDVATDALNLLTTLSTTRSRGVRIRLMQLLCKVPWHSIDVIHASTLTRVMTDTLAHGCETKEVEAEQEATNNMVVAMTRNSHCNEAVAKVLFDGMMETSLRVLNTIPVAEGPDQLMPAVVRALKAACVCPTYQQLLKQHVDAMKANANPTLLGDNFDPQVVVRLWKYLAETEATNEDLGDSENP